MPAWLVAAGKAIAAAAVAVGEVIVGAATAISLPWLIVGGVVVVGGIFLYYSI